MTAADLDKVMSCGLGTRYAFIGPWETAYLNADGKFFQGRVGFSMRIFYRRKRKDGGRRWWW